MREKKEIKTHPQGVKGVKIKAHTIKQHVQLGQVSLVKPL